MKTIKKFIFITIGPFWSLVHSIPRVLREQSWHPGERRKCFVRRLWELFYYRCKTLCVNDFYNAYGMDLVGSDGREYVNEYEFWRKIIPQNYPSIINHGIVLRDKRCLKIKR